MKKIVMILFAVSIVTANALAQGPPPPKQDAPKKTPEERAENMTKRLTKELALNPEQQAKTKAIILKREQDRDKMIKTGKEGHEKMEAEFKAFLSDEQFKKFQAKEAEMKKKREERKKQGLPPKEEDGPPPPPPAPEQK